MQTLIPKQKNLLTVAMVAALSVSVPRARAAEKETTTKPAKAEQPQLQLTVDVPSHWRPFLSNDLAEAFASRLADVFRRSGYPGDIQFLDQDTPNPEVPVLAVRVINWRIGRTESAECSLTATFNQDGHQHALGAFEHTSLAWHNHSSRLGRADALGDVADAALRDLSAKLDQAGLLQGLTVSKS